MEEELKVTMEHLKKQYSMLPNKNDNRAELEKIDTLLEEYGKKISDLREKLANEDNYKRVKSDFEVQERPVIEELLDSSFEMQRKDLLESKDMYLKIKEDQNKHLKNYQTELEILKEEVNNINKLLYKDQIARSRNYTKQVLSDDKLNELKEELKIKEDTINSGIKVVEMCNDEIANCNQHINDTDVQLQAISEKQARIDNIKGNKINNYRDDTDTYKKRIDEDQLASLEAGYESLKMNKEYLMVDPKKMLAEEIARIEGILEKKEIKDENKTEDNEQPITKDNNEEKDIDKTEDKEQPITNDNNREKDDTNVERQMGENLEPNDGSDISPFMPNDASKDEQQTVSPEEHKVTKIQKVTEFLKKHKKAILVAGGLTALALLAQPVIVPAIMHANSVLWFKVPALQGFLHGCNVALGNTIGASYASSTGLWTSINGGLINAGAAQASLLAALSTHAISISAIGIGAKKLIDKIKNRNHKKDNGESTESENDPIDNTNSNDDPNDEKKVTIGENEIASPEVAKTDNYTDAEKLSRLIELKKSLGLPLNDFEPEIGGITK